MGSVTGSMTVLAPGLVLATVLASGSGSESEIVTISPWPRVLRTAHCALRTGVLKTSSFIGAVSRIVFLSPLGCVGSDCVAGVGCKGTRCALETRKIFFMKILFRLQPSAIGATDRSLGQQDGRVSCTHTPVLDPPGGGVGTGGA